jgi:hypothetical protein
MQIKIQTVNLKELDLFGNLRIKDIVVLIIFKPQAD